MRLFAFILALFSVGGLLAQPTTENVFSGTLNIVTATPVSSDFQIVGFFNDLTGEWAVSDVDTAQIVWDIDGNRFEVIGITSTSPLTITVRDINAAGAVATGLGAIMVETSDFPVYVSGISPDLQSRINNHFVQVVAATGGGGGTDDQEADEVPITDAGGYFSGSHVEAALQEVGASLAGISDTDDQTASEVPIVDAGGHFTGTNVEAALQELGGSVGSGIENVVEDSSPQLGGDLDLNGYSIIGTGSIGISGPIVASSLSIAGNITLGGTVDGRDVAADGLKLDGIESGATADQLASEVPISDAGGYYSGSDVEAALQELGAGLAGIPDTEAELESSLSDVSNVFTNNDGALDDDDLSDNDTDDLSEGLSNLYFTDDRAQTATGGMFSGNTETLIDITYQPGDQTFDAIVENDLALFDNTNSNFSTTQALEDSLANIRNEFPDYDFSFGDGTTSTSITDGESIDISGGVNGVDVVGGGTNELTVNLDFSELSSQADVASDFEFAGWTSGVGLESRATKDVVEEWIQDWFATSFFVDGTNVTGTYDDVANTYTVDAAGGGGATDIESLTTSALANEVYFSDGTNPTSEAGFEYDPATNDLSLPADGSMIFAQSADNQTVEIDADRVGFGRGADGSIVAGLRNNAPASNGAVQLELYSNNSLAFSVSGNTYLSMSGSGLSFPSTLTTLGQSGAPHTIGTTGSGPLYLRSGDGSASRVGDVWIRVADDQNVARFNDNLSIQFHGYGSGTFDSGGTETFLFGGDADGNILEVDLSTYANTDEQGFDVYQIAGTELQQSIENDGDATQVVDLAVIVSRSFEEERFDLASGSATIVLSGTLPTDRDGIQIIRNGLLQAEGGSADYTVSGSTITFSPALVTGEVVLVKYPAE